MTNDTETNPGSAIGKHMRTRLVSGLLVLIPLAITLFILNLFFSSLTAFVRPLMRPWVDELPEYSLTLIALFVTAALIYLVGLITTYMVGRRMIQWGETLLLRLPIVKSVYSASKQVVETFSSSTKAAFKAVVLVEFPRRDSLAIGFITGTILNPEGQTLYRVFVATTPNPTSGFLVILPEVEVQFTDISVEDGIKMIVSGGMLAPPAYRIRPAPLQLVATADSA
jgi:uncharacterized membrane protein